MKFYAFRRISLTAAVLALAVAVGAPALSATGGAQPLRMRDLLVIEKQGQLLAFGYLDSPFSAELVEALHGGVTTRFIFEMGLVRSRRFLYDAEVVSQRLVHQVKYDALKKAYTFSVLRNGEEPTQKITQSRQELTDWMSELNGVPIAQLRELDPSYNYYLRVRAKVNSVDFAFPFNYLLAFLGQKTEWAYSPTFGANGM